MKTLGIVVMFLGVIIWLIGIRLQNFNHDQLSKVIFYAGQALFVSGGIIQIIAKITLNKKK